MGLSLVHSRALVGLQARQVCVEVHLANGLPSFTLVALQLDFSDTCRLPAKQKKRRPEAPYKRNVQKYQCTPRSISAAMLSTVCTTSRILYG